ncbi:MAG: hypothetical protein LCH37_15350 [Bacteroidetes bacterium]|nr:hypothetical protein [Bacteroidota bacterium]
MQKLLLFFFSCVTWLYSDSGKAWESGGILGAGITATVLPLHINYIYWIKVVVSALIGGLVNLAIKKLVDRFSSKRKEDYHEQ